MSEAQIPRANFRSPEARPNGKSHTKARAAHKRFYKKNTALI